MARMTPGSTTDDYRKAMSGDDDEFGLGYQWTDKPHRLVYDLCGEVDRLREALQMARITLNIAGYGRDVDEIDRALSMSASQ